MAHRVVFNDFDDFILNEDEVRDFIDLFYRWGDATFRINTDEKERKWRGLHSTGLGEHSHTITLSQKNITRDFNRKIRIGGNMVAPSLRVAAGMVLAHEIQHANQAKFHLNEMGFYGKKIGLTPTGRERKQQYNNRACERDARQFVDEHLNEICAYFSVDPPTRRKPLGPGISQEEVLAVADLLGECSEVSIEDIKDELRASKVLTPNNVQLVLGRLQEQGFEIKQCTSGENGGRIAE